MEGSTEKRGRCESENGREEEERGEEIEQIRDDQKDYLTVVFLSRRLNRNGGHTATH